MEIEIAHVSKEPLAAVNMPTKDDLLRMAKEAIAAGDQSMHDAAEALATAQELHGASQAEMARAIGKSEAWVSLLLQWRRTGFKAESPFGPTTKAARLKHAKDRAASGTSRPRKSRKSNAQDQGDANDTQVSADKRNDECAKQQGETRTSTVTNPLDGFKSAVDYWLPKMSYEGKCEAVSYMLKKSGVRVS
jgi:hypothetical protein